MERRGGEGQNDVEEVKEKCGGGGGRNKVKDEILSGGSGGKTEE